MSKEILTMKMEMPKGTLTLMSIIKEALLVKASLLDPNFNTQVTFFNSKKIPKETFASLEIGFLSSR